MDDADADTSCSETTAPAHFTEDLILEILFYLPAKSLHRFKCVSRQWLGLISDLDHRSRMSQTLAGFFYIGYNMRERAVIRNSLHFTSARADDDGPPPLIIEPSALSLPPPACKNLHRVADCSNGLVLLRRWNAAPQDGFSLTICNPATDEWAAVPDSPTRGVGSFIRLAVDPAAVSPFRYFLFQFRGGAGARGCIVSAEIYSSESGEWTYRALGWEDVEAGVSLRDETSGVFFRGMLHLAPLEPVIVSVDGDGNTWKTIPKPSHPDDDAYLGDPAPGFIGVSQGRLHFLNTTEYDRLTLCDWEQDEDGGWVMKHCVSLRGLFAGRWDSGEEGFKYSVIAIHPDCNIVYLLQKQNNTLLSYALNSGEGCVIRDLGLDNFVPYLPYVPRFSVPLAIRGRDN